MGIFETMQTAVATPHRGFLLTSAAWREVLIAKLKQLQQQKSIPDFDIAGLADAFINLQKTQR